MLISKDSTQGYVLLILGLKMCTDYFIFSPLHTALRAQLQYISDRQTVYIAFFIPNVPNNDPEPNEAQLAPLS